MTSNGPLQEHGTGTKNTTYFCTTNNVKFVSHIHKISSIKLIFVIQKIFLGSTYGGLEKYSSSAQFLISMIFRATKSEIAAKFFQKKKSLMKHDVERKKESI